MQAPEVFIGNYSLEADMWAAGMTMYQLLVRIYGYLWLLGNFPLADAPVSLLSTLILLLLS